MPYPQTSGKGAPGAPGVGVASSAISYQVGSDGNTVPAGSWVNSLPSVPKGQYLWTRTVTSFTNGTTTTAYSVAYSAQDGAPGTPGNPGSPGQPGSPGEDGVGVTSANIMYATASSSATPPTSGWSAAMPAVSKGQYLWTRTATAYSDGSSTTAYSLGYVALDGRDGVDGKDGEPGTPGSPGQPGTPGVNGVGVASSAVMYQTSTSGTTPPTGSWSSAVPSVSKGQYLWSRTVITYTDNTTSTVYGVAYQAVDGSPGTPGSPGSPGTPGTNGVGIASQTVTYQSSTSGTTPPTGTWSSSVPTVTKGQFLWTRVVQTLTDATTSTFYSVSYQGADGSPGTPGTNGTNGTSYAPQSPVSRSISVATAYQHTDTSKPYKVQVNARATQTVTLAGTIGDRIELRIGPTAASVASGGSGGFSVGIWESGITGIAVMIGAAVADGGQLTADVPAGWYFSVNRLSGTAATIVSCFSQSMAS